MKGHTFTNKHTFSSRPVNNNASLRTLLVRRTNTTTTSSVKHEVNEYTLRNARLLRPQVPLVISWPHYADLALIDDTPAIHMQDVESAVTDVTQNLKSPRKQVGL